MLAPPSSSPTINKAYAWISTCWGNDWTWLRDKIIIIISTDDAYWNGKFNKVFRRCSYVNIQYVLRTRPCRRRLKNGNDSERGHILLQTELWAWLRSTHAVVFYACFVIPYNNFTVDGKLKKLNNNDPNFHILKYSASVTFGAEVSLSLSLVFPPSQFPSLSASIFIFMGPSLLKVIFFSATGNSTRSYRKHSIILRPNLTRRFEHGITFLKTSVARHNIRPG